MMARLVFAFAIMFALTCNGRAEDANSRLVERWYAALANADRAVFDELLADDAKIILEDLDTVQTKAEFLDSLDEWKNAMRGTALRHRIDRTENGTITVFACYQFPNNAAYMREVFSFRGGRIIENAQSSIGEACEGF